MKTKQATPPEPEKPYSCTDVINVNGIYIMNYYLFKKENDRVVDRMSVFHNLNAYDALNVHISNFDHKMNCDARYWARMFYIISALPENKINLFISDSAIKRGKNIAIEFWKAYHTYIEKQKIKYTLFEKESSKNTESKTKEILKSLSLYYHTDIIIKSDILLKSLKMY